MLRIDSNRAVFKGYTSYPSLTEEMAKVKKEEDKKVEITPEILEIVNDLLARDRMDLSEYEKRLVDDCNNNKFKGVKKYPGVTC